MLLPSEQRLYEIPSKAHWSTFWDAENCPLFRCVSSSSRYGLEINHCWFCIDTMLSLLFFIFILIFFFLLFVGFSVLDPRSWIGWDEGLWVDVGFSLFFPLTNDLFVSVIVGQLVVIVLIGCAFASISNIRIYVVFVLFYFQCVCLFARKMFQ